MTRPRRTSEHPVGYTPLNCNSSALLSSRALREAQDSLKGRSVELRVHRINLDRLRVDIKLDDALDLVLVAANP